MATRAGRSDGRRPGEAVARPHRHTLAALRVAMVGDGAVTVVDVRQPHEFDSGHVRDAINIALHELPDRLGDLSPDRELWIHCASGYRASIAAALLDRQQRRVVLIDDDYDNAEKLDITSGSR